MKKWFEFSGELELPGGKLGHSQDIFEGKSLLTGANGVGKSSLVYAYKVNRLSGQPVAAYCDQGRLESFLDLKVADIASGMEMYLAHFGREDLLRKSLNDLSGGENQLVKIALCFSHDVEGYFFDEPYQYLSQEMCQKLSQLFEQSQKNLFVIDHSDNFVKRDHTYVLTRNEKTYRLEKKS
jgi:translation initiation factor RLI1